MTFQEVLPKIWSSTEWKRLNGLRLILCKKDLMIGFVVYASEAYIKTPVTSTKQLLKKP
jgi:hypothetical protein